MYIDEKKGYLQDWITQVWVKLTGRTFNSEQDKWLVGPVGNTRLIKDKFIHDLAAKDNLQIEEDVPAAGLLESIDALGFNEEDRSRLNNKVVDFYEHTSNYNIEIWSEWCRLFKPFGWLLSVIFSKRLQQLNLPLNSIESAKGINSSIIKLNDASTGKNRWTVWYRILKSTRHVIYSGVYTTCDVPNMSGRFLKVVFPLPNGNATVIMKKEVLLDGS
jgi:hypothetical protein